MRNKALEGLKERKLEDIQLDTLAIWCFKVIDVVREIQS